MLKKEFKRKDVQRARNLIMGNTGASTGTQIGYKKEIKEYKREIFGLKEEKLGLLKMVLNKQYLN